MAAEIGKMHQGDFLAKDPAEPRLGTTPERVHHKAPVPRGRQHEKETPGTFGRNPNTPR